MKKKPIGKERRTVDDSEESDSSPMTDDPHQLLDDLLKRTEEMEHRLARIIADCENMQVFDDSVNKNRLRSRSSRVS